MEHSWTPIVSTFRESCRAVEGYGPLTSILKRVPFSTENMEMCKMPLHFSSYLERVLAKIRRGTEYLPWQGSELGSTFLFPDPAPREE